MSSRSSDIMFAGLILQVLVGIVVLAGMGGYLWGLLAGVGLGHLFSDPTILQGFSHGR